MDAIFTGGLGQPSIDTEEVLMDYEAQVKKRIEDACDFEESYLARWRENNMEYYYGDIPAPVSRDENGDPINRSSVVSTDVRDTVLTVLPSLIRIFQNDEGVVFYEGNGEADEPMAAQATDYVGYSFWEESDGFLLCYTWFKDCLTAKMGIGYVCTDNSFEVTETSFSNITPEQYQLALFEAGEGAEVVYEEAVQTMTPEGPVTTINCTIRHEISKPITKFHSVPPWEFRISRFAKSIKDADLIGWYRCVSVSEAVKRGIDPSLAMEHYGADTNYYTDERLIVNPGLNESQPNGVMLGDFYIRIDSDGDGIDELHHIVTIGDDFEIVSDDIVPDHNFAVFYGDPRPHTIIGDCLADLTKDVQQIKTAMLRANLDNLVESTNPKMVVNELVTHIEDALNDEVGAVIRTRGDPNSAVAFSRVPYVGKDLMEGIDYMDKVRASRTGITEASKGLDPRAMQSTALVGIDAIVSGAQERIELLARVLAETGFKRLFQIALREITNNPSPDRVIKVRGQWIPVQPSTYDPNMKVKVNPTLGKGTDVVKMQALQEVKATQMMIMEKFGVNNPVVSPIEFLRTVEDMLSIANIKNFSRYFKRVDENTMKAIASQPKEPDPATLLAQAELEKVKKDMIIAAGKLDNEAANTAIKRFEAELKEIKILLDDNFRRDKLQVDTTAKVAEMAAEDIAAVSQSAPET